MGGTKFFSTIRTMATPGAPSSTAVVAGGSTSTATGAASTAKEGTQISATMYPQPSSESEAGKSEIIRDGNTNNAKEGELLALPSRSAASTDASSETVEGKKQVLEVGGEPVTLDAMGPIILNEDGSMSRITNWHEMMEHEQKNTLRIIAKRNAQRRAKLLAKQEQETAAAADAKNVEGKGKVEL